MSKNIIHEDYMKQMKGLNTDQCVPQEMEIQNVRLAAAYVPYQKLCTIFTPLEGLKRGTLFPELYSPYEGKGKKHKHDREDFQEEQL